MLFCLEVSFSPPFSLAVVGHLLVWSSNYIVERHCTPWLSNTEVMPVMRASSSLLILSKRDSGERVGSRKEPGGRIVQHA